MLQRTYKKVLDALPFGVFAFDEKLRMRFANAAFRRSFSAEYKKGDNVLACAVGCGEKGKCGDGAACRYCAFLRVMRAAIEEKNEQTETVHTSIKRADRINEVSVRIRVLPADEKGKLFLGLTDGTYRSEMEREMLSAQKMQQRLLPSGKNMGGIPYDFLYVPCLGVGGDLLDVYELDGDVYGVLADVSGKGLSAGMLSAFVRAGFDKNQSDLGKALAELNGKFNELKQDERSYITAATIGIDRHKGVLKYALAGHNAPILLKTKHGINEIENPSPPISNWMADWQYAQQELPFERGDMLVMVTDGVTECMNAKGEQFGIERTESVLLQSTNANDFIGKLKTALSVFSGGNFSDDITAVAFDL